MLRDHPRTSAYADALVANSSYLKGKVVLDVGCGTGILCMLAVRAGAKKVIGVDMSSIISRTQKVIEKNGMSDVITLVRGRLEDVKLPLNEGTSCVTPFLFLTIELSGHFLIQFLFFPFLLFSFVSLTLLPIRCVFSHDSSDEDVDIIVSEWMGYGLYFENMLTSV